MAVAMDRSRTSSNIALVLVLSLVILLTGLVASSGSPIAVALVLGLIVGSFLLAKPDYVIWLVLAGTLIINGLVGLAFPGMTKAAWLFSLLGFFLLGHTFLARTFSPGTDSKLPTFIWALLGLMIVTVIYSIMSEGTILEVFAGVKRTFQLWGLMLALAFLPVTDDSNKRYRQWFKFVFIVALIQLPIALFERIVLVPKRVGLGGGVVPIDVVSGTFEAKLEGGGSSSIMVIFLVIVLAYVFSAWKEKLISPAKMLLLAILLGSPLFLGETKIALVLLPMMFAMVFASEIRRRPVAAVSALAFAALITVALAWIYFSVFATGILTPEQQLQKSIDYNFGSVGYYDRYSLNRTTAITFWFGQHGLHNPVETIFGHGIGSSYSGSGSLVPGHLNRYYPYMAINLTGMSTLLWDTGLIGTALFLVALLGAWQAASRLHKNARSGTERAEMGALKVSVACIAFSLFYSNSLFAGLSHETIFSLTLGYLAWLIRRESHRNAQLRIKNVHPAAVPNA